MTRSLEQRLCDAVAGTPLALRLPKAAAPLVERYAGGEAAGAIDERILVGLARALAARPRIGPFLSHRPVLFERIARADPGALSRRERELEASPDDASTGDDLELSLDALRLLRREETCFAACVDLAGLARFEDVSDFLSILAETITRRALHLAETALSRGGRHETLSVVGMGKIAGREFTYESDLDLIFLYRGGPAEVDHASRVGQRMIAYLTTMTGAGIAYAVDTRLRPSGQQGMLVTSFSAFERYQSERAETWERLALLRARAIAGDVEPAREVLDRTRSAALVAPRRPWRYLADLRRRVEVERGGLAQDVVPLKTGPGGLMDVDFLAGGGLLERGGGAALALPSVSAMLRASVAGERVERLLLDYRLLRIVEARARWIAGRGIETLSLTPGSVAPVAELVEPGLGADALLERLDAARRDVRAAYDAVIEAETIDALAD